MARPLVDCPIALPAAVLYARLIGALAAEVARLDALGPDVSAPRTLLVVVRPTRDGCRLRVCLRGHGRARAPADLRIRLTIGATDVPRLLALLLAAVALLIVSPDHDDDPIGLRPDDSPSEPEPHGVHPSNLPTRPKDRERWRETWKQLHGRFGPAPPVADALRFLEAHYPHLLVNRHVLARLLEAGARHDLDD